MTLFLLSFHPTLVAMWRPAFESRAGDLKKSVLTHVKDSRPREHANQLVCFATVSRWGCFVPRSGCRPNIRSRTRPPCR